MPKRNKKKETTLRLVLELIGTAMFFLMMLVGWCVIIYGGGVRLVTFEDPIAGVCMLLVAYTITSLLMNEWYDVRILYRKIRQ